jgi:hypothetical protein
VECLHLLWPGRFCLDCLGEVVDDYFYGCVSSTRCHSSLSFFCLILSFTLVTRVTIFILNRSYLCTCDKHGHAMQCGSCKTTTKYSFQPNYVVCAYDVATDHFVSGKILRGMAYEPQMSRFNVVRCCFSARNLFAKKL